MMLIRPSNLLLATTLLVALPFTSAAAGGSTSTLEGQRTTSAPLQEGKRLYAQGRYDAALAELDQVRTGPNRSDPPFAEALLYSGLSALSLGRTEEAASWFIAALAVDPQATLPPGISPKAQAVWAEVHRDREDSTSREAVARRLVDTEISSGIADVDLGRADKAVGAFRRALARDFCAQLPGKVTPTTQSLWQTARDLEQGSALKSNKGWLICQLPGSDESQPERQ